MLHSALNWRIAGRDETLNQTKREEAKMRIYNGCPGSELQEKLDKETALLSEIVSLEPEAHCTYYPIEELYRVHKWGNPISKFHSSKIDALNGALGYLKREG